jgi:cell division transport system permease protein
MFVYFCQEALANFNRNKWLSLASVSIITFTLAIFGLFFIVAINFSETLKNWKEDISVIVYLKDSAAEQDIKNLQNFIKENQFVKNTVLIDKTEALKKFSEQSSEIKDLLTGFDSSILPASIEITVKEEYQKSPELFFWLDKIKKFSAVDEVNYDQQLIDKLTYIVSAVRIIGFIIGIFLCGAAILIISNTIKLSVYEKKEEIEIMELIGATRAFIKIPFLIEGMFQGLLGSISSIIILYLTVLYIEVKLFKPMKIFLNTSGIVFMPSHYILFFVIGGLLLGTLGGVFASGRTFKITKPIDA